MGHIGTKQSSYNEQETRKRERWKYCSIGQLAAINQGEKRTTATTSHGGLFISMKQYLQQQQKNCADFPLSFLTMG